MTDTQKRRQGILAIIATKRICTQKELARALSTLGFETTQATISRDIMVLGLVKVSGCYAVPDSLPSHPNALDHIKGRILDLQPAGNNLLVLHTPVGEASGVALWLDRMKLQGIVGTIAGDDTIFVACPTVQDTNIITKKLTELMA